MRLAERWMVGLPLVLALAGGCSSDTLPATASGGAGGTGVNAEAGVAGAGGAAGSTSADAAVAMTMMVSIPAGATGRGPAGYTPNPATVTAGTTVMWMNNDTIAHTATSTTGVWDSGVIPPGGSYSRVFSTPGTYPYYCTIHGAASMSGAIIVE